MWFWKRRSMRMDEERYDRITGKPIDKSYLEKGLPDYLQKDLDVYKSVDPDDSIASEGPWYCLYATINEVPIARRVDAESNENSENWIGFRRTSAIRRAVK